MALSAKLQVRQSQSLVITPQLMQAIRLLQMAGPELEAFIAAEVEQNPLLEHGDTGEGGIVADLSAEDDGADRALAAGEDRSDEADAAPADLFPEQFGSDAAFAPSLGSGFGGSSGSWDELGREPGVAATESLTESLERRIDGAFAQAPADRLIALALFAALDEAGYLTVTVEAVAARLGASCPAVERVLGICQGLAPTGMFARSLSECLALQLAERNRLDPAMQTLLANLERLALRDRAGLMSLCGVDAADLGDMIAEVRALDPKPGLAHDSEAVRLLVPDVFVRPAPDGGWVVELNDEALPKLLVNRAYCARIAAQCGREGDRRFISDCLAKASWLEKSLDQRARTVLNVATEIVRRQEGFLADGIAFLRPLNLRMVADALGIHESTVSRAAANKTLATPRGIFEFRTFFSGAIPASAGGEAHSAEAVKHQIRKLILEENVDAVLSDDAIVALLSGKGVEIARRTVAKYRELMGIGSSVERRRQKRLKAAS
jgi:RNA polymerase sigma-54 factor